MASADSIKQGLAQSQEIPGKNDLDEEYEDPARSWIDLVTAFHSGNPASVRAVLTLAKSSHWSHDKYDDCLEEDPDYSGSDTEKFADEDEERLAAAARSMRSLKQADIDDFFEE